MSSCFLCGRTAAVGGLCSVHADVIASSQLTSEQIQTPRNADERSSADPTAWLIDQWGVPHQLIGSARIGRSLDSSNIAILHPSVSTEHARIEYRAGQWFMLDLDSLNGSFCNRRNVRETALRNGDQITFGDVGFYFSNLFVSEIVQSEGRGRTFRLRGDALTQTATVETADGLTVEFIQRPDGGVGRIDADRTIEFGKLEFGLLKRLIERRQQASDPELSFVPWQELSENLAFRSRDADSENVRELVRRVRRKLKRAEFPALIESRQGVGYRMGATITSYELSRRD